ncbi:CDC27 protein [Savitreella phatthalungensis]
MTDAEIEHLLDKWVIAERKIVTQKLLSRLLRCKVSEARDHLLRWRSLRPDTHATYMLYGSQREYNAKSASDRSERVAPDGASVSLRHAASENPGLTGAVEYSRMVLVSEEDLQHEKASLDVRHCVIYSVEPARLQDVAPILSVSYDVEAAMADQPSNNAYMSEVFGVCAHIDIQARESRRHDLTVRQSLTVPTAQEMIETPVHPSSTTNRSLAESQGLTGMSGQQDQRSVERAALQVMMDLDDPLPIVASLEHCVETTASDDTRHLARDQCMSVTENADMDSGREKPPLQRGKKRIKRQTHSMDSKGYMVTKDEYVWVSDDEMSNSCEARRAPTPKQQKAAKSSKTAETAAVKTRKPAGSASIATYFTKKKA